MPDTTWGGFPVRLDGRVPEGWVGLVSQKESIFTVTGRRVGQEIHDSIDRAVRSVTRAENAFIEQRILAGDDRVVVKRLHREYVYTVPSWRSQPIVRFKVWLARRKYRRSM